MTELSAIKVKATLFLSAVIYAVGVAVYVNGIIVASTKDIEANKKATERMERVVEHIMKTRWETSDHDRYAAEVERRLSRLENR